GKRHRSRHEPAPQTHFPIHQQEHITDTHPSQRIHRCRSRLLRLVTKCLLVSWYDQPTFSIPTVLAVKVPLQSVRGSDGGGSTSSRALIAHDCDVVVCKFAEVLARNANLIRRNYKRAYFVEVDSNIVPSELDIIADGNDQLDALKALTGQARVPNTFIGDKSVSGNSDIQKLHKDKKLVSKLQAVSAL
ncbi:hypothetical protein PybrP1_007395, partial [[Pythium] brassicae (nom. inval.)]